MTAAPTLSTTTNPLTASSSLFWNETELMNAKLWGGDTSSNSAATVSTKSLKINNKNNNNTNSITAPSNNNNNNNGNNSNTRKNLSKTNEDEICDEEGIANGIREIEIRFENELEEQEKLWPDPENLT